MKGYEIRLDKWSWTYVLADSREKAVRRAITENEFADTGWSDVQWNEIERHRLPSIDGGRITYRQLFDLGTMIVPCKSCNVNIHPDDDDFPDVSWSNGGYTAWCSPECFKKDGYLDVDGNRSEDIVFLCTDW